ncbi:MAG: type II toxin-antitoxin system VapC family toxin [Gammaproteobacteria bacterium]|nr:MAG: type II toxin-antitoxin system VapC family toxin [Gammaproteobacteria bacterium]
MEPESTRVAAAIEADANRLISAATVLDCFSYALARVTGEPLLFKGDDFTHTDITPVAY